MEINGHNSYIVINNSTIEEFYNGGFNTEIVLKNNSKIKTESGKSYKTSINWNYLTKHKLKLFNKALNLVIFKFN